MKKTFFKSFQSLFMGLLLFLSSVNWNTSIAQKNQIAYDDEWNAYLTVTSGKDNYLSDLSTPQSGENFVYRDIENYRSTKHRSQSSTIYSEGLKSRNNAYKVEQCRYIQITPDGNNVIFIPCDFPVLNFARATQSDLETFKATVSEWKLNNPGFDDLSFLPETTLEYFEIAKSTYDAFSEERKSIISSVTFFYQIN